MLKCSRLSQPAHLSFTHTEKSTGKLCNFNCNLEGNGLSAFSSSSITNPIQFLQLPFKTPTLPTAPTQQAQKISAEDTGNQ